jgi:drug/metabolite transporter (DMT)-like permease
MIFNHVSQPHVAVPASNGSRWIVILCLLGSGTLLGLSTNLAKVAASIDLSPLCFLTWSVLGAGALMFLIATIRGHLPATNGETLRYSLIAGLLSIAAPNLIAFTAAPRIGVGFVAVMIALPPLLTYAAAVALRMETFDMPRALAVVLALSGALWIAAQKLAGTSAQTGWIAVSLAIPVLLATGNIYRSRYWPKGARPDALSLAMMIAAALHLLVFGQCTGQLGDLPSRASQYALIAVQALAFALQYLLFFVLQQRGGPVLLSLMGAVAAVVAVPIAVLVLGEVVPDGLYLGAGLISAGITLMALRTVPPAQFSSTS